MGSLYGDPLPVPADRQAQEKALLQITGIGPTIAAKLVDQGVDIAVMADWTVDDIDRMEAVVKIKNHHAAEWPEMARAVLERHVVLDPDGNPPTGGTPQPDAPVVPNGNGHDVEVVVVPSVFGTKPLESPRIRHRMDRNRDFGAISGSFHGAQYSQDNRYYGNNDLEVFEIGPKGEIITFPADAEEQPPKPILVDPTVLDLRAWQLGRIEYPFPQVRKKIQAIFDVSVPTPKAARAFLASAAAKR